MLQERGGQAGFRSGPQDIAPMARRARQRLPPARAGQVPPPPSPPAGPEPVVFPLIVLLRMLSAIELAIPAPEPPPKGPSPVALPATLAGLPRRDAIAGLSAAGVYGTGLSSVVVAALPGRFGGPAYQQIETYGQKIEGVDADVRCTGATLEVVFPRTGAPAELIDGFAAVREAFQISKALRALIG